MLSILPRAGQPGRELAVRLDLLRSIGWRNARRRHGDDKALAGISSDQSRCGYWAIWQNAAEASGAELFDLSRGFFELRRGSARALVWNHWTPLDDAVTLKLALDKPLLHQRLTAAGVPVPEHTEFDAGDIDRALMFLAASAGPCVVKPADGSGGSGTTTGVRLPAHLRRAVLRSERTSRRLLVERQVAGHAYRLLFLDGELLDVVRRNPPSVVGDGSSTISELIATENERRIDDAKEGRPGLLRIDLDCVFTLEAAGLGLSSVPAAGTGVPVKTAVSQNAPCDNESVTLGDVAPELVDEARLAVKLVGLRLACAEIVTPNPGRSLEDGLGVLLEVNGTPGLHYHYEVRDPSRAMPVAVPIVQAMLGD